jgi:fibronectin-binding autotransporter adhesin
MVKLPSPISVVIDARIVKSASLEILPGAPRKPGFFLNRGIAIVCAAAMFCAAPAKAGTGFFGDGTGAAIFYVTDGSTAGEGTYTNVGSLNNLDYGDFIVLNGGDTTLMLRGGESKTFKNGSGDVFGVIQYYRIYVDGASPGDYTSFSLPFDADLGGGDQRWKATNQNANLLSGLMQSGRYIVEFYWEQTGNEGSNFMSNGGANYKTYFDLNYEINTTSTVTQDTIGGAATLSGNGTFVKKDSGTVQINANNSAFTGNAFVDQGTLEFLAGSYLTSGSITLGPQASSATGALRISDSDGGTNVGNMIVVRANGAGSTLGATNTSGTNSYSGQIYLDGNAGTSISSGGTLSFNGSVFDLKNQTLTVDGAGTTLISAPLTNSSGSGKLVKQGAGTLTLSGNNTYVGATTISAGTLEIGSTGRLGGGSYAGAISNDGLLLYSGTSAQTLSGVISGSGSVTHSGTALLSLSGTNSFTGTLTINSGSLTTINNGLSTSTALVVNGGNANIGQGTIGSLTLNSGTLSGGTKTITAANYYLNGGTLSQQIGVGAVTVSTGTTTVNNNIGALTINIGSGNLTFGSNNRMADAAAVTVSGGILNMGSTTDTIGSFTMSSGSLLGTGTLTASNYHLNGGTVAANLGTGTMTVNGSVTLSGTAGSLAIDILSAGNLTLGSANRISNSAAVSIAGGVLDFSSFNDTVGSFSMSGGSLLGTGTLTAATYALSGGTLAGRIGAGSATINGTVLSTGTINADTSVTSGGNLALNGILNGNLTIGSGASATLGSANRINNSSVVDLNGGTLDYVSYSDTVNSVILRNGGNLLGDSAALVVSNTNYDLQSGNITARMGGSTTGVGIVKTTSGTVVLSGSNSFAGAVLVNAGALRIQHANALGTTANSTTVADGAALEIAGGITTTTESLGLSGNGISSGGALRNISADNSYTGLITLNAASRINSDAGTLTLTANLGGSGQNLTVGGAGNITITSNIGTESGGLIKDGLGTLILSGGSTYTGATTINAGTLQIGAGGGTGSIASPTIVNNSALLVDRTGSLTLSSNMSGTGTLTKNGSGTLVLTGSNTYSGGTTLNAGNLTLQSSNALGTATLTQSSGSSLLTIDTTGTLTNTMSLYNVLTLQSATLSGAITVNNATFDVDDGDTLTLSGGVGGTGGVTKNGTGNLVLSGSNTYSGATIVNAGVLEAANANALGSTTGVTVNGGSLLVSADDAINSLGVTLNKAIVGDASAAQAALAFDGVYSNTSGQAGALTLSQNSIIDLGTGGVEVHFASIANLNSYILHIFNWEGDTVWSGSPGGGKDQFYVDSSLSSSQLDNIRFYSGTTQSSFISTGFQIVGGSFNQEIIAVPEPETYATAILLLVGFGIYARREFLRRRMIS